MGIHRNLFEKHEGHCDYCSKPFTKNIMGVVERFKVNKLIVCYNCYQNYRKNKHLYRTKMEKGNPNIKTLINQRANTRFVNKYHNDLEFKNKIIQKNKKYKKKQSTLNQKYMKMEPNQLFKKLGIKF